MLGGAWTRFVDRSIDRVMDYVLRSCIIYNVAWEDPRIDGKVLNIGPDDTLLMLTTGGCNVLDRLLDGAKKIVSVDLNVAQNALLELKLAGARALTHEQFFQLFAHSNRKLFDAVYESRLRPLLSAPAAAFWDTHASFFDNVMYSGASGGLAKALCILAWLFGLQPLIRAMHKCETLEEQRELFKQHDGKIQRLVTCFNWLLPVFCPFAGVPASQLRLEQSSKSDAGDGPDSIIALFFERIFGKTHIASDNYFYYAYLYGKYSRTCCPRYLQPEYFERLKAAANEQRVEVRTQFLHEAAAEYPDGYFTAMVLLDHMDWLSNEQIAGEWATFSAKLHPTKARVLWRSFAYDLSSTPNLKFLTFDAPTVAKVEEAMPDRVGMYNSTHLATMPPNVTICEAPPRAPAEPLTSADKALTLARLAYGILAAAWALLTLTLSSMVAYVPAVGSTLATTLSGFLSAVGAVIGALAAPFTPALVTAPLREGTHELLTILPGLAGGTWVDLGAGLAPELEAAAPGTNVCQFASVHLVQLPGTPPAPAAATPPTTKLKTAPKVHKTAVTSISPSEAASELASAGVGAGCADLVTLSHGLVAEADWKARVALATSLLKPGGYLAVCDLSAPTSASGKAFWGAVQPQRALAPHHEEVMMALHEATAEVHTETTAAKLPLTGPASPAHFLYVGQRA